MTTPYRDDRAALEQRLADLESELASVRIQLSEADRRASEEARLEREISSLRDALQEARRRSLLEQVRFAAPCNEAWGGMLGDDRVRHCPSCDKSVYNLSAMPRDEAERFVKENADACVQLYRRRDGTVITADCPVGVRRRRSIRTIVATAVAIGGAAVTYAFFAPGKAALHPSGSTGTRGRMVADAFVEEPNSCDEVVDVAASHRGATKHMAPPPASSGHRANPGPAKER